MNKSSFDESIKNKLSHLPQENKVEGAWDVFKQKLDSENDTLTNSDPLFDDIIKHKVHNYKYHPTTNSWSKFLEYKYQHIDKYRNILRIKLMEIAAVLLLLLTFVQWFENTQIENAHPSFENSIIIAEANSVQKTLNEEDKLVFKTQNSILADNSPRNKNNSFSANSTKSNSKKRPLLKNIAPLESIHSNPLLSQNELALAPKITLLKDYEENIKNWPKNTQSKNNPYDDILANVNEYSTILPMLSTLPTSELYSEFPLMMPMNIDIEDKRQRRAISGYVASDFNLINTPFDKIYSLASYQREFINNSYGLGISQKNGAVEYQFDIAYANRDYEPRKVRESFGGNDMYYFEKSLDKISFDIVTTSLFTKYHFINKNNWSSYLTTIATFNWVMKASYDITENKILGRPSAERFVPETPRLDQKPFNMGVINDHSLAENYFVSAGVGFGIEKSISDKMSIFVEASHHRHLFSADIGVGPNKDKIHTSSIKLGAKTYLN